MSSASPAHEDRRGIDQITEVFADADSALPELIRGAMTLLVEKVRQLEARIGQLERELAEAARHGPACKTLLSIPGVV